MSPDIMKILHDVPNTYVDFFVSLIVKIICPLSAFKLSNNHPKVTYSDPKMTYSYPQVTYSDSKVTHSDPTHLPLPQPTSPGPHHTISQV